VYPCLEHLPFPFVRETARPLLFFWFFEAEHPVDTESILEHPEPGPQNASFSGIVTLPFSPMAAKSLSISSRLS